MAEKIIDLFHLPQTTLDAITDTYYNDQEGKPSLNVGNKQASLIPSDPPELNKGATIASRSEMITTNMNRFEGKHDHEILNYLLSLSSRSKFVLTPELRHIFTNLGFEIPFDDLSEQTFKDSIANRIKEALANLNR